MNKKQTNAAEQRMYLSEYEKCCDMYYKNPDETNLEAVRKAERLCNANGVRSSEMTKARFNALNRFGLAR